MSAKHGAKERPAWTKELYGILLDGIEDNRQGKELAHDRLKALHPLPQGKDRYPKDFEKGLTRAFEKTPEDGVAPWLCSGFWQHEVDKVLIQGIFARNFTQDEVVQRIHSVWPKLSISWLDARMEEVARSGLPGWMDQTFWTAQVEPILTSGLRNASQCRSEAVEMVVQAFPHLEVGMIRDRIRRLRKQRPRDLQAVVPAFALANGCNGPVAAVDGQADSTAVTASGALAPPSTMDQRFWRCEIDPILLRGIQNANQLERETVDKVLRRFSELRIGTIWARLRRLQEQQRENEHTGPPFRWTDELDQRLIRVHEEAGLSAAVSGVQSLTGWPRKAILRRAHKLGLPTRPLGARRRWTMVEYRFVIESLNHMSVREIAEQIERSEKAVWDMVGPQGHGEGEESPTWAYFWAYRKESSTKQRGPKPQ